MFIFNGRLTLFNNIRVIRDLMGSHTKVLLVCFLIILSAIYSKSYAQMLVALAPRQVAFSYTNGLYANQPVFALGAARTFHIHIGKLLNDHMTLFVDLSNRTNFGSQNKMQFIYGGQGYIIKYKSFKVLFRKTFTVNRFLANDFKGTYVGGEIEVMPGIYKNKYYVALDLYYGDSFSGHVTSNANTQNVIIKGHETGWIKPHLRSVKTGINVGYYISHKFLIHGHIDYAVIRPLKLVQVPFVYGTIGISYIFDRKPLKTVPQGS